MYIFTEIIYTSAFNLLHISQCHIRESISRLAGIFLKMGLNCFYEKTKSDKSYSGFIFKWAPSISYSNLVFILL